jgi:hypothetical protein
MDEATASGHRAVKMAQGNQVMHMVDEWAKGKGKVTSILAELREPGQLDQAEGVVQALWGMMKSQEKMTTLDERLDFAIGVIASGILKGRDGEFYAVLGSVIELDDPRDYVVEFWDEFNDWYEELERIEECDDLCWLINAVANE